MLVTNLPVDMNLGVVSDDVVKFIGEGVFANVYEVKKKEVVVVVVVYCVIVVVLD